MENTNKNNFLFNFNNYGNNEVLFLKNLNINDNDGFDNYVRSNVSKELKNCINFTANVNRDNDYDMEKISSTFFFSELSKNKTILEYDYSFDKNYSTIDFNEGSEILNLNLKEFFKTFRKYSFNKNKFIFLCSLFEVGNCDSLVYFYNFNKAFLKKLKLYFYNELQFCIKNLKKKNINIYLLDTIFCYRGWRHFKGFPTRGQRTWSNSWTAFRSNKELRSFKMFSLKKFCKVKNALDVVNTSIFAEYLNLFYKLQCEFEWKKSRKIAKNLMTKRNVYKIDLNMIAKGEVQGFVKSKTRQRSKKKKLASIGFKLGFTRILMNVLSAVEKHKNISRPKNKKYSKKKTKLLKRRNTKKRAVKNLYKNIRVK